MQGKYNYSDDEIVRALAVAGLIGNLIKRNASISGAECGCQAEIGSACSMAAAALCTLCLLYTSPGAGGRADGGALFCAPGQPAAGRAPASGVGLRRGRQPAALVYG